MRLEIMDEIDISFVRTENWRRIKERNGSSEKIRLVLQNEIGEILTFRTDNFKLLLPVHPEN
jgi:hypothetical protein